MDFTSDIHVLMTQCVGDDSMICDVARVSTLGSDTHYRQRDHDRDAGLIRYLMANKHGSPFEHGSITFLVEAPIFVFWDHVRHRIGVSYNIESSRYRDLRPVFFVAQSSRTQSGKPGHYQMTEGTADQTSLMKDLQQASAEGAWEVYQRLLAGGIAREQAMQVLPMNTVISAFVTFNPRSLMNFLELRLGPARQELQRLAKQYMDLADKVWPVTMQQFRDGGMIAP